MPKYYPFKIADHYLYFLHLNASLKRCTFMQAIVE